MLPHPDPKTPEGQLRICHNQTALALASLARINLIMQQDQDQMPSLMATMVSAKNQVDAAHNALQLFSGMLLPCQGTA